MTTTDHQGRPPAPSGDAAGAAHSAGHDKRWLILFVVLLAQMMDVLDTTVVNIGLPTIRDDLGGSYTAVQWLVAGYTLAFAITLITGGRLGDVFGRRRVFTAGALCFTLASAACALAQNQETLLISRVAQGLFAGVTIPQVLGIISGVFPRAQLGKAFAFFGPVLGLSSVVSPVLGGWLVDADLFGTGWRAIFLINLPLGLIATVGALVLIPRFEPLPGSRLDIGGIALITVAMTMLVFPLLQGREYDWPAWGFAMMAGSLVVFALFALHERRSSSPLIAPSLFRKRHYTGGLAVICSFFCALTGFILVFALFAQVGLGYSPMRAGTTLIPWALGMAIGSAVGAGALAQRIGRHVLHIGAAVGAAGLVALFLTMRSVGTDLGFWDLAPGFLAGGIGSGMVVSPMFKIILSSVEPHEVGSGSGLLTTVQQFGATVGVAVVGTIFFSLLAPQAQSGVDAVAPTLRQEFSAAQVSAADHNRLLTAFRTCAEDQADVNDPSDVPASCRAVTTLAQETTHSPAAARKVGTALREAAAPSRETQFLGAMKGTIWVAIGLYALTFALIFALPRQARPKYS
ncbi:MFS transporter [Streptomyces sp. NBC_00893]|uniref:MFS transporter n=1 Tax=Streptomyces sp. NBC_00893 TaxID=2975862 RepID=UPI00225A21DB|nr:MFS transporter [Streptomyces sp. NBC_00893]MCX4851543.1 MFS transporter [Streptomyces sp. NBC_00893]